MSFEGGREGGNITGKNLNKGEREMEFLGREGDFRERERESDRESKKIK